MSESTPEPKSPMDENEISRFNLNISGHNPDIEFPNAKEGGTTPAEDLVVSEQLKHELNTPVFLSDPDSGQIFEALSLNQDAEGVPIVMTQSWSVDSHHEGTLREAERVALISKRPLLVVNNPGTSESSDLTREQQKDLEKENGIGFMTVANSLLRALEVKGISHADFEGTSMGARLAVAMAALAAYHKIKVGSLVIVDPPGMSDKKLLELGKDFGGEAANMNRYAELTHEKDENEPQNPVIAFIKFAKETASFYANLAKTGARTNFWSYTNAMKRGTLPEDLAFALETQPNMQVTFIYGTASNISSPESIMQMYQEELDDKWRKRVRLKILPGDTHALGAGHRMSWHITEALKFKHDKKVKDSNQ